MSGEIKNFDDYTELDTAIFKRMTIRGGVAIFLYSPNVYTECQVHRYVEGDKTVKAIAKSGVTYVPSVFFEKFLGADLKEDEKGITLSLNGNTLSATFGSDLYTLNTEEGKLDLPLEKKNGYAYLPAVKTAKLLGVTAKSYNEDLLTVFGEEFVATLDATPGAVYAGGYLVLGDYDKNVLTKENMTLVKDKWRAVIVGSKELNDLSDPMVLSKIASVDKSCERTWAELNKSSDRYILFGDKHPTDSVDLLTRLCNVRL